MSFLDKIDEYCAQHNKSQTRFEKDAGLAKGLISKWRSTDIIPRVETLQKISDFMEISLQDLLREDAADFRRLQSVPDNWSHRPDVVRDASLRYVPVYRHLNPDTDSLDPDSIEMHYAVMPEALPYSEECFGYTITDSGMAPEIQIGDVVIVRKDNSPESGDIVLVSTPGEETICRKLIRKKDCIILQPFSTHHDAELYRTEELDLLPVYFRGKVVAVIRSIRSSSNSVPEM